MLAMLTCNGNTLNCVRITTYIIYLLTRTRTVCTKVISKGRSEWRDVKKDKRREGLLVTFYSSFLPASGGSQDE
jgi:hypothetical protein